MGWGDVVVLFTPRTAGGGIGRSRRHYPRNVFHRNQWEKMAGGKQMVNIKIVYGHFPDVVFVAGLPRRRVILGIRASMYRIRELFARHWENLWNGDEFSFSTAIISANLVIERYMIEYLS